MEILGLLKINNLVTKETFKRIQTTCLKGFSMWIFK
jgi:hypothetical protein